MGNERSPEKGPHVMSGRNLLPAIFTSLTLVGCVINVRGQGPQWVGQPVSALVERMGMPDRQMTSPSGATVYIYGAHNIHEATLCEGNYFVRADQIVGYAERGVAINCGQTAGNIH
jgi:hypothetical protein